MIRTYKDDEYDLTKLGKFYRTKEDSQCFKAKNGDKYYWKKGETYGEWLKRIINCL
jgi:hypothetical protein